MMAILQWGWGAVKGLTLRALADAYYARVLYDWDRTGTLAAVTYNLGCVIQASFTGKVRMKPKTLFDFHPYRKKPQQGLRITHENFGTLRLLANVMVGSR